MINSTNLTFIQNFTGEQVGHKLTEWGWMKMELDEHYVAAVGLWWKILMLLPCLSLRWPPTLATLWLSLT